MTLQSHSWTYNWRKTWSERIHAPQCSLLRFNNSHDMEVTYVSINRGMDEGDAVHIYKEILLSNKKGHI